MALFEACLRTVADHIMDPRIVCAIVALTLRQYDYYYGAASRAETLDEVSLGSKCGVCESITVTCVSGNRPAKRGKNVLSTLQPCPNAQQTVQTVNARATFVGYPYQHPFLDQTWDSTHRSRADLIYDGSFYGIVFFDFQTPTGGDSTVGLRA